jgi:hypothetical protein
MTPDKTLDGPAVIGNGEDKVTLFYLADKDRVWHRAKMKIAGEKLELTAAGVPEPHGVAYACNGVGALPNVYNKAMLPLSPFIYFDNKLVASKALNAELQAWPDAPIKVEGVKIDPSTVGKQYEYRKMPLLSNQFRDNAVLQADMPVTFWGSTIHPFGYEAKGKAEIKFSFAGIEKTIPVTPGMKDWQVTVPPMKAGTEPKSLKVTFTIDGELAHERVCTNMIIGDVWYVAAPPMAAVAEANAPANDSVRVMTRKASRDRSPSPARYSVASSTTLDSGYASRWEPAKGSLAGMLGQRIAAKTGRPVGIIFMQSGSGKDLAEPELKNWIDAESLVKAPSLMEDHKDLAAAQPGNPVYDADVRRYLADWKKYWSDYIPKLIAEKRVPDGIAWGTYPAFGRVITTTAGQSYNVLTCPFWPGSYKGVVFLTGEGMFTKDQGANFGEQFTILANSWKEKFACPDPRFFYTIPNKTLAPKLTTPAGIKGASTAIEIDGWLNAKPGDKDAIASANTRIAALFERIIQAAYP